MSKRNYFVEEVEGWEDGVYKKTIVWKPVERQEAQLIEQAIEMKEVARAQQKLLEQHRQTITLIPRKSAMAGRISMGARREVVSAVTERYRSAQRAEKGRILDAPCATTGWHRKHAARALRQHERLGRARSRHQESADADMARRSRMR
ncbi:hypothetical protein QNJ95_43895 [Bradyrhizobium elkanii]|uniref:hypothetical protein n=1 Tax=Bradyrhizobium elkanii TaxID=29448 RepID=UPI002711FA62|nr:hypothetical protein [Bradyrhizobium elkanii]WLA39709.1 hypothetical protein QNJ95_43895 [Bradyrhizobium elkanii]